MNYVLLTYLFIVFDQQCSGTLPTFEDHRRHHSQTVLLQDDIDGKDMQRLKHRCLRQIVSCLDSYCVFLERVYRSSSFLAFCMPPAQQKNIIVSRVFFPQDWRDEFRCSVGAVPLNECQELYYRRFFCRPSSG